MARRKTDAQEENRQRQHIVIYPPGLNLRAEPSKSAFIVRVLKYGETVTEREEQAPDGWMAVNGGYVMQKYLE